MNRHLPETVSRALCKALAVLLPLLSPLTAQTTAEKPSTVVLVEAGRTAGPLNQIWNGVMGDLSLALTIEGEEYHRRIAGVSRFPIYRRTMGLLNTGSGFPSSANIYQEDSRGRPYYDFTLFDRLFDTLTGAGMIPFVCLSFMPEKLSSAPPDSMRKPWEHPDRYPPRDYDRWQGLIAALVSHAVARYGRENVAGWKWEVWNEPDLQFFWQGTREEYFKLYDYTAEAVKSVLPGAGVGGNAVAGAESDFLDEFIRHCQSGTNFKSGAQGTALDFISFHMKGGGSGKQGNFTSERLLELAPVKPRNPGYAGMLERTRRTLRRIGEIPGTAGIPVYITECDIDFGVGTSVYEDPNALYRNNEYFPVFQCALAASMTDIAGQFPANPVKGLIMDTFYFPGRRIFEGQRTLFTAGGVEKPVFNALRLLGKLGNERLRFTAGGDPAIGGLAAAGEKGETQVLLYNFNQAQDYSQTRAVELKVSGLAQGACRVTHYRIDREHSNAYAAWRALGAPVIPSREQLEAIRSRQGLETLGPPSTVTLKTGELELRFDLPPHSVSLLVIEPQS